MAGDRPHKNKKLTKEVRMMATTLEHRGDHSERDGNDVSALRPARSHHVVARDGDKGLEVLRVPLEGKGLVLPVFSAGWAARGYLFAEAPGGGWYVRVCTPGELVSLLVGLYIGVECPGRLCWHIVEHSHQIHETLRGHPSETQVEACILGHAICLHDLTSLTELIAVRLSKSGPLRRRKLGLVRWAATRSIHRAGEAFPKALGTSQRSGSR
jgi:hypothetical protein